MVLHCIRRPPRLCGLSISTYSTRQPKLGFGSAGLRVHRTKTKAMRISPSSAITTPMNTDGEHVEYVPSFTYCGSIISADGSIEAETTSHIGKTAGAMKSLFNALWYHHMYETSLFDNKLNSAPSQSRRLRCFAAETA